VSVTLAWCLSPLLGLILGPLLGSLSDRCAAAAAAVTKRLFAALKPNWFN